MKKLIENSIEIYGMGHPNVKHVFNIVSEDERNDRLFKSLESIKGRKLTIRFKYDENDIIYDDKLQVTVEGVTELEIKDFITTSIGNYLNPLTGRKKRMKN